MDDRTRLLGWINSTALPVETGDRARLALAALRAEVEAHSNETHPVSNDYPYCMECQRYYKATDGPCSTIKRLAAVILNGEKADGE